MLPLPYVRLDSSVSNSSWRFPAHTPEEVVTCESPTRAVLRTPVGVEREWDDPLEAVTWMIERLATQGSPDMRWVGYFSYDLGRLFETISGRAADDTGLPLFRFSLQYMGAQEAEPRDLSFDAADARPPENIRSTFNRAEYELAVALVRDYIADGDVFQVNLAQRFTLPLREHPAKLYARLRRQSPARYGACLCYDDFAILSNSPELFLRIDPPDASGERRIVTRPIKGTRPRDAAMDVELRDSPKDQAELNMIIDVERNDLGRVCKIGSVKVIDPRTIEAHPTVYHGVATIEGLLRAGVTFVDVLRATFPGGSVTGAPKIRAMQIIDQIEPVRRGPYCGAIGYFSGDGSAEFNVAIRTMIAKDGAVHVPVGGGIVADSDPLAEYEETLVKARAMFAALGASLDDPSRDA